MGIKKPFVCEFRFQGEIVCCTIERGQCSGVQKVLKVKKSVDEKQR